MPLRCLGARDEATKATKATNAVARTAALLDTDDT